MLVKIPTVCCHYFLVYCACTPQLHSISALWLVWKYTAGYRKSCKGLAKDHYLHKSGIAESRLLWPLNRESNAPRPNITTSILRAAVQLGQPVPSQFSWVSQCPLSPTGSASALSVQLGQPVTFQFSSSTCSSTEPMRISGTGFSQTGCPSCSTHPTASNC